ncbi:sensor histidine kinase [Acidipila sp. EB88]|uniref:sensor histidine kinase n=1 Tax=Acidipila sp. EB88 TaxID=2305226 RepID=UPI000F5E78D7|nr:sensor histidine kinase [Acidipila sp. EB88]
MPAVAWKQRHGFSWSTLGFLSLDSMHRLQLLYVGFWIIEPVYDRSFRGWALLVLACATFLPLFTLAHEGKAYRTKAISTLGLLLLAFVYVPSNISAFGIFVYVATSLPHLFRGRSFVAAFLALESCIFLQYRLLHLPLWEFWSAVGACTVSGLTVYMQCKAAAADARLRMAHDEIEQLAKTAERERIARDLHDVLGHTLSLISVKSELAGRLLATDPERTAQELADIQVTARRALAEVRHTVSGYKAQGLPAELQQAVATLSAAGVAVTHVPASLPRLSAQQEASLALLLREAVTNIVRHAEARHSTILLEARSGCVELEIADDGRGMQGAEGNGLRGMRERVRDLGGTIMLRSGPGLSVRIIVPVEPAQLEPSPREQARSFGVAAGTVSFP